MDMKCKSCCQIENCLKEIPLFKNLTDTELLEIQSTSSHHKYKKGQRLLSSGDKIESLFILKSGKMKLYYTSYGGKEHIIKTIDSGSSIGEYAIFTNEYYSFFVEALEKSEVCKINKQDLISTIRKLPDLAIKFLSVLSDQLKQTETKIKELGTLTVEQRIVNFLLDTPPNMGEIEKEYQIQLKLSKKNIASILGTTRETLTRKLLKFEKKGWISIESRKVIKLKNKEALKKILHI